jgi:hypothetical protein
LIPRNGSRLIVSDAGLVDLDDEVSDELSMETGARKDRHDRFGISSKNNQKYAI